MPSKKEDETLDFNPNQKIISGCQFVQPVVWIFYCFFDCNGRLQVKKTVPTHTRNLLSSETTSSRRKKFGGWGGLGWGRKLTEKWSQNLNSHFLNLTSNPLYFLSPTVSLGAKPSTNIRPHFIFMTCYMSLPSKFLHNRVVRLSSLFEINLSSWGKNFKKKKSNFAAEEIFYSLLYFILVFYFISA